MKKIEGLTKSVARPKLAEKKDENDKNPIKNILQK